MVLRLPVRVRGDDLPRGSIRQLDCQESSLQAQVVPGIRALEPDADQAPSSVRPRRIGEHLAELAEQVFVIEHDTRPQGDLHRLEVRRALDGTAGSTSREILAEPQELLNVSVECVGTLRTLRSSAYNCWPGHRSSPVRSRQRSRRSP